MNIKSIGREKAIALADSKWWIGLPAKDIATFQLLTSELTMPFGVFHEALEETLGRPVFTHELGMNYEGLVEELLGKRPAPSLDEIIALIPIEKRVLVMV